MGRIRNIAFDLGGVIGTIDQSQAVKRFEEIGLKDAAERLDPYTQTGIFGDLEAGKISAEQFKAEIERLVGHPLTDDELVYAWTGYFKEVPLRNLHLLDNLRKQGYKLILLSNTNPFVQRWANSEKFSEEGRGLASYFDARYLSYECRLMKPDERIFRKMLVDEQIMPDETLFVDDSPRNVAAASELGITTFCPVNGDDWTSEIFEYLK